MISGRCYLTCAIRVATEFSKHYFTYNRTLAPTATFSNKIRSNLITTLCSSSRMASSCSNDNESDMIHTNKLALEKSPYLLQHAHNPVEWYPWGDEALEKAKREDKLIFLSIGYSTCHWCHVMEKESFENEEIAQVMNRYFVNIKVDREERPDIDRIYMTYIQAMTGHGGWPMSVFLTPNLTPVRGGTYFPPEDRNGQPGFKRVLLTIAYKWLERKKDILESSSKMFKLLKFSMESTKSKKCDIPSADCAFNCVKSLSEEFDEEFGGFSPAPKFPQPMILNFLFTIYARNPTSEIGLKCLHMCSYTLQKMAQGGIHDHVGQGFSRYSVDGKWHVPHFEKMLYDQGQLLKSYTDAYLATKDPSYIEIINDIVTYVTRDLRHPEGGFFSAEDADSYPTHDAKEKREGAFYVWTYDEIESILNKEIAKDKRLSEIFCHHYCVKPEGNVRKYQHPHGELEKQNVLIIYSTIEETAEYFGLSISDTKAYLKEALDILYEARKKRPRPHLDDKIVTAWNGLMISGLAYAGSVLENQKFIDYAEDAAKFIEKYLFDSEKNLLLRSCYCDKDKITQASVPIQGFHTDYAFLVKGLLDLYEATFKPHWIEFANKLQKIQDNLFWDSEAGGYFLSAINDSSVILRIKDDYDGAEPSSNAVACKNLLILSSCLTCSEYKDRAEKIISSEKKLVKYPVLFPELLCALLHYNDSSTQIYIAGNKDSEDTKALIRIARSTLLSGKIIILADEKHEDSILYNKNQVINKMKLIKDRAAAYVCKHRVCSLPVTDPDQLAALLNPIDK